MAQTRGNAETAGESKILLTSWTKRRELSAGVRYATRAAKGVWLVYKRPPKAKAGRWYVKWRDAAKSWRFGTLGTADDGLAADGVVVLNFDQAIKKAGGWEAERLKAAAEAADANRPTA